MLLQNHKHFKAMGTISKNILDGINVFLCGVERMFKFWHIQADISVQYELNYLNKIFTECKLVGMLVFKNFKYLDKFLPFVDRIVYHAIRPLFLKNATQLIISIFVGCCESIRLVNRWEILQISSSSEDLQLLKEHISSF